MKLELSPKGRSSRSTLVLFLCCIYVGVWVASQSSAIRSNLDVHVDTENKVWETQKKVSLYRKSNLEKPFINLEKPIILPTRESDSLQIPIPEGKLSPLIRNKINTKSTFSKIPNECITIVQVFNGMDWDGLNGSNFSKLAANEGSRNRVSSVMSTVLMYLYAKRHGHGYRLINLDAPKKQGVFMGEDRVNRHPAWSRIPLLSLLYEGGVGDDLVLGSGLTKDAEIESDVDPRVNMKQCQHEDSWIMYSDIDVGVLAAAHSIGEIVEGMRLAGKHSKGLPCQSRFTEGSPNTSWCSDHAKELDQDLSPGIDPSKPVTVAAFKDGGNWRCAPNEFGFFDKTKNDLWNIQKNRTSPTGTECPNAMKAHANTGVMFWRVPTRIRHSSSSSSSPPSTSKVAKLALEMGKQMMKRWRQVRIAPKKHGGRLDDKDYLSVGWFEGAQIQGQAPFTPESNVLKCRTVNCGQASDQPVFNWAILYGLPQKPYEFTTAAEKGGVGRFLNHISILECDGCFRESSYRLGDPFFHGTTWKFKRDHLLGWFFKLGYEFYGLEFPFSFIAETRESKDANKMHEFFAEDPPLEHSDKHTQDDATKRFKICIESARTDTQEKCIDKVAHRKTILKFDQALAEIRDRHTVVLRLNPSFKKLQDDKLEQGLGWYELFWKPPPLT